MPDPSNLVPFAHAPRRLLAVDDNAESAELVARIAKGCGFQARSTNQPRDVATLLRSWLPDILTLDLCMPEQDGVELLSMLEERGFSGKLIIISGQDDRFRQAIMRLAKDRGLHVAAEMAKPVDVSGLRALLRSLQSAA